MRKNCRLCFALCGSLFMTAAAVATATSGEDPRPVVLPGGSGAAADDLGLPKRGPQSRADRNDPNKKKKGGQDDERSDGRGRKPGRGHDEGRDDEKPDQDEDDDQTPIS